MQGLLNQMRELTSEVSSAHSTFDLPLTDGDLLGGGSFGAALKDSLERINTLQSESAAKARAFQTGDPDVALHEVMIAGQKASIGFELGVQVRNRLLTAYKDIMNMQV
ncbi:flagellar hook-basal body complex protein FliE [Microbulbifer elongatus]|uniref:Flagellar hook-basal body complex protein FliE n=2 Tax=Microbulbifer elongatus TaxID=86173 RepID=A0ABT1NWX5_9GAMM|nr:flagellar hook-basal body complex protein FliE [Microbulbifer elongatus]